MPLQIIANMQDLLIPVVKTIKCEEMTRAYIISIFSEPQKISNFTNESITLTYATALSRQKFDLFQDIGDYILFIESVWPTHLKDVDQEYYITIGQLSFYKCYNLTRRKMPLYEELADSFYEIIHKLRNSKL